MYKPDISDGACRMCCEKCKKVIDDLKEENMRLQLLFKKRNISDSSKLLYQTVLLNKKIEVQTLQRIQQWEGWRRPSHLSYLSHLSNMSEQRYVTPILGGYRSQHAFEKSRCKTTDNNRDIEPPDDFIYEPDDKQSDTDT